MLCNVQYMSSNKDSFYLPAAWQFKKEKNNWTSLQNKEAVILAVSKKQTKTVSGPQSSLRRFNRKLAVHQKCIRRFGTNKEHHPAVVLKFCSCPTMHSMLLRKFSIKCLLALWLVWHSVLVISCFFSHELSGVSRCFYTRCLKPKRKRNLLVQWFLDVTWHFLGMLDHQKKVIFRALLDMLVLKLDEINKEQK